MATATASEADKVIKSSLRAINKTQAEGVNERSIKTARSKAAKAVETAEGEEQKILKSIVSFFDRLLQDEIVTERSYKVIVGKLNKHLLDPA